MPATTWLGGHPTTIFVGSINTLQAEVPDYDVIATQLLPHGLAWSRRPDSTTVKLSQALARTHARTDWAIRTLLRESNPATSDESLDEWEDLAGLPGDCASPPTSLEDRRAAVVAKLFRSRGPLNRRNAEAIATSLGYTTTSWTRTYGPLKCGGPCGKALAGTGGGWPWSILFTVGPSNPDLDGALRCILVDAAHAYTTFTVVIS